MLPDTAALLADAVELAQHHWKVFPLCGKVPAIPWAHSRTLYSAIPCADNVVTYPNPLRDCKGGCGRLGHGLYDATDDVETVIRWWSGPYAGTNIGGRIPESMLMIDIDPRHGGDLRWASLIARHGSFPECLVTFSGRDDGGAHLNVRRPPGRISAHRLGPGIDLKTSNGYAVMAQSVHPDTGKPYVRVDGPVPAPPEWFIELVTHRAIAPHRSRPTTSLPRLSRSISPADAFCAAVTWAEVLRPHGWECLDSDPDEDGAPGFIPMRPRRARPRSATNAYSCTPPIPRSK